MRLTHFTAAAALVILLGGCGELYSDHAGEALRSNAGFTRENPPPVGPPVSLRPGHPSDIGDNASQAAPTGCR